MWPWLEIFNYFVTVFFLFTKSEVLILFPSTVWDGKWDNGRTRWLIMNTFVSCLVFGIAICCCSRYIGGTNVSFISWSHTLGVKVDFQSCLPCNPEILLTVRWARFTLCEGKWNCILVWFWCFLTLQLKYQNKRFHLYLKRNLLSGFCFENKKNVRKIFI